MLLYRPTPVASAGADGPVSADPPETDRPLDPAKKVAATRCDSKKVAALKISCGGLFTHFDSHRNTSMQGYCTYLLTVECLLSRTPLSEMSMGP